MAPAISMLVLLAPLLAAVRAAQDPRTRPVVRREDAGKLAAVRPHTEAALFEEDIVDSEWGDSRLAADQAPVKANTKQQLMLKVSQAMSVGGAPAPKPGSAAENIEDETAEENEDEGYEDGQNVVSAPAPAPKVAASAPGKRVAAPASGKKVAAPAPGKKPAPAGGKGAGALKAGKGAPAAGKAPPAAGKGVRAQPSRKMKVTDATAPAAVKAGKAGKGALAQPSKNRKVTDATAPAAVKAGKAGKAGAPVANKNVPVGFAKTTEQTPSAISATVALPESSYKQYIRSPELFGPMNVDSIMRMSKFSASKELHFKVFFSNEACSGTQFEFTTSAIDTTDVCRQGTVFKDGLLKPGSMFLCVGEDGGIEMEFYDATDCSARSLAELYMTREQFIGVMQRYCIATGENALAMSNFPPMMGVCGAR